MKSSCILILLIISILWVGPASSADNVFLFSYFKGNGEDGLHLAYSEDGLNWTALKNDESFLTPMVGGDRLMRDPSIVRGPDGIFHMVWTVSWNEKVIGYASSENLIDWSPQKEIPVMVHEEDARNSWAPEVFYDSAVDQFLIFWATTIPGRFPETEGQSDGGLNHRIYFVTTRDFQEFSRTELLYDDGFNVIDSFIVRDGDRYVMFLKDETNKPWVPQKNIKIATSDHAVGPYSKASDPITGEYWAEGPTAIKIGDLWHLYFDRYTEGRFGLLVSKDLKEWEDRTDRLSHPEGMRHGTVFEVDRRILEGLRGVE
ncbi:MAG: glycoside hydrolase family 43 protein [Candidatus Omnitrophica bacterium]|nr:glycoside hydrolase family 43 protein [Candidatus Omnitrophota bacterium]